MNFNQSSEEKKKYLDWNNMLQNHTPWQVNISISFSGALIIFLLKIAALESWFKLEVNANYTFYFLNNI